MTDSEFTSPKITLHEPTGAPRELGVNDIDEAELTRLCMRLNRIVSRELSASVKSIYVMGSFARGEARRIFSDLDIRIRIAMPAEDSESRECEQKLKNVHGPEITPSAAGYLDPHITILRPGDNEPHVEVAY